jgi:hypothetical protein
MTHDPIRLSFKIDAFQPDSIPMARLAEYMADLATVLGEKASVHFVELVDGCVQLIHEVDHTAYPKVEERARAIRIGDAPAEALNAYRGLNKKLVADNTFATYTELGHAAEILDFPGVKAPKPLELLPVEQPSSLVGVVQGVGGRSYSQNVPVFIDTGDLVHACVASRGLAKELGHFILDGPRRFEGLANWHRDENGAWLLRKFEIRTHAPVGGEPLSEIVERLRGVPSELSGIADPWGAVMQSRQEEGEPH